jgi:hypothetical protein
MNVSKKTSELRKGDVVGLYGATYRLIEDAREVSPPRPEYPGESPCYGCKGELVQGSRTVSQPTWWFQGNDLATWGVEQ